MGCKDEERGRGRSGKGGGSDEKRKRAGMGCERGRDKRGVRVKRFRKGKGWGPLEMRM